MSVIEVSHLTKEYRLGALQGLKQKLLNTAARLSRNTMQPIDFVGCAVRTIERAQRDTVPAGHKTVRTAHPTVFLRRDLRHKADYYANLQEPR